MGRVNLKVIEEACKKQIGNGAMQAKNSKEIKKAIKSGKKPSSVSMLQMQEAGNKLLEEILDNLPPSLARLKPLLTTSLSELQVGDGYYRIDINFPTELLRRKSLYPEKYNEGIENIVALFNKGYSAKNRVYGYWATAGKRVASVTSRPSLYFMQKAIDDFNNKYAQQYHCRAELGKQYKRG